MNITPVNPLSLQTKYATLSRYAQRYMKSQVKSTSFALERFLGETDPKLITENEEKLKNIGIIQIGKDIKEGIRISDNEYNYHVFSSDDGYLGFDILRGENNELYRHFRINDKSDIYCHSGDFSGVNIEDEMNKILDFVSGKLYKAKRECSGKPPLQSLQSTITSEKVAEANKALHNTVKNTDTETSGYISEKEEELINSINEKLLITKEMYKKISDCRTRWEVKKTYPNYLAQPVANKIGFKNIGPNGESVSLFNTSYRNNAHTAITVTDTNGKETNFVISKTKKSVQKNFPSKYVKSDVSDYRILLTPDYYTQKELDESKLPLYLSCLDKEMGQFIEHTQGWFDKKAERKLIRSNHDAATLESYKDLLDDVHSNFENYRTKMRKFMRKPHKNKKFKEENNISTKLTSTAVKFDNITPEGYDLRLSYPKVHDKTATQLLVMKGDKVEKSFYIINNKLLRFDIKDTNDKIRHYNQNMYYYDNKYLQDSNLDSYLKLVQDKLHELNEKLDGIRKKQIENRERYHIKTSKKE